MPRQEQPGRNDRGEGVYGVHTGTAWDAAWPAIARFTNSVARWTRRQYGGVILLGVSHDTDLSKKKRRIFTAAGGVINPPGIPHKRGTPKYFWQGERVGKKRAFKIVQQIKRGRIPSTPPAPPPVKPPPVVATGPDQFSSPYADFGLAYNYGPRRRFKRKKKSKLRSAAGVLAAAATRGLQTGEEVFGELLARGRSVVRQVEPEFQRLLNRGPMSDFERLLRD